VPGGAELARSLARFLDSNGDRGAGEIDVSRPRWRDEPSLLFRAITGGLSGGEAGGHRRKYEAQVAEGEKAARRLVAAAGRGPLGPWRGWWVGRLCRVARAGMGLREHPKFALVRMLGVARREVLADAEILAQRGQLLERGHVWHLGFDELAALLDDPSREMRQELAARDEAFRADRPRRPPVAMSSDGETPTPSPDRQDLPAGAMAGTAASNGVVEGIARVVREPDREVLRAGEILVAPFTDPGWTPLFVHAAAVVTEVGGLMTHGAVVAREYGIPAVVSVAQATERIETGQRIRVDGTRGFVLILSAQDPAEKDVRAPAVSGRP
jgi:pyruvate,water dikinase